MLFLLFGLERARYALDAQLIVEVLPLVQLTPIPGAPAGIAGVFLYQGAPVPAIDLSELMAGHPAPHVASTRMILVKYADASGRARHIGPIAERATETMRRERADFVPSGITSDVTAHLGPIATDDHGIIQWLDPRTVLPASVRDSLFQALEA